MFCPNCGKEIVDDAVVCVGCGRPVKPLKKSGEWGTGTVVLLMLGTIVVPIIGIVAGIVGLTKKEKRGQGAALLIAGIIMTIAYMAVI